VSEVASSTLLIDRPIGQVMAAVAMIGRRSRRVRASNPAEDLIKSLYAEHGRSLLDYTTRLTGDRAAAEDVVQETLLRAWKHADALQSGVGSVRGWLLTVARNLVTDRARARAVRPMEVNQPIDVPAAQRDHADTVVDTMTVMGALEGLSAEHRAVLVELYYRGRTVNETAAVLGIAPGTVKSRTYHAVRALRAQLAQSLGRSGEVRR
jgi:RNA polymerase sigma-70 factor (ECF subfamily)